ncbi:MAG TPA: bifunctional DNA-formamidopyrimidine glycosylase/DNA-(apurinic or apyrimidinic site) lyase [Candidatus Saccharimonadales bacterium]|nr:bifunctional DNA-formamidopyrimidine glycosylase/DNA-(apurinic or apyrimidinic site) lyase [Candidatus Saccharimonadales bacterium]
MPELPEVETVRIGLSALLPGRVIAHETHDWPKGFPNAPADVSEFLIDAKVTGVRRRAKVLIIDLSTNYSLVIHLKMTGQLVFRSATAQFGAGHPNDSLIGELPDKSTRVTLTCTDGSRLFFNDQRKFGWMRLLPTPEVENLDFFKKVGPEPLADDFTAADFAARIRRRPNSGIKAVLLDQTVVAGIGNIYADESLWGAKIHPETKVNALSTKALHTLFTELQAVLRLSIEKGGSTDRNYVSAEGKRGSYLTFARAFRREGQPCPRCGTLITKMRVAGRGTHICPFCQKQPR